MIAYGKNVGIALGNPVSSSPRPLKFVKRGLIQKKLPQPAKRLTDAEDADGEGRCCGSPGWSDLPYSLYAGTLLLCIVGVHPD